MANTVLWVGGVALLAAGLLAVSGTAQAAQAPPRRRRATEAKGGQPAPTAHPLPPTVPAEAPMQKALVYNGPIQPPKTWTDRVFNRVSKNEGPAGYNSINADRDSQGLSWGMIQWSQNTGSLGALLQRMNTKDPVAFLYIFGSGKPEVVNELLVSTASRGKRKVSGYDLWSPYWTSKFTAASQHPAFQEAQREALLFDPHFQAAWKMAHIFGLDTERAFTIYYDIAVQHGPNIAPDIATNAVNRLNDSDDYKSALKKLVQTSIDTQRRSTQPAVLVTRNGNVWRPVGDEWHLFTPKGQDFVTMVTNRRTPLLTEDISDDSVDWRVLQSPDNTPYV